MSDNRRNLRRLLSRSDFPHHASHALLEPAILDGVDERVDAAVGEHQNHGKVVQPASKVERVTHEVEHEQNFDQCPACSKAAAYYR